jgi:ABC-2 type transport system permease protein
MILIVGPALISPDLRNAALPLYLSRPLNKTDYVLGKLLVVVTLASAVTWVPGLILFVLQASLGGKQWLLDHYRIGPAIFFSFAIWILVLSLFSLAVSSWVKWKPWARILFLGLIFTCSALGQIFKLIYGSWWGSILVLNDIFFRIWDQFFGIESRVEMPLTAAWISVFFFASLSLFLLYRRIRAFEVVT